MDEKKKQEVHPAIESLKKAEEGLDDLLKRLGRIERHLIDLKNKGVKKVEGPLL